MELPPFSARGFAALAASLILAAWVKARGQSLAVPRGEWGALGIYALLNVTAWMGLATVALQWLTGGEGALVAYTMPIWAVLLAWPVLGERPRPRHLAGLGLGLVGVTVLMLSGGGLAGGAAKLPGLLIMLAAAFSFALAAVLGKRRPLAVPPMAVVVWQVGLGGLPILAASLLTENPDWGAVSTTGWLAMLYMAAIPLCLCYATWFGALRRLPAGTAAMGTLVTPVIGMLASGIVLGEPLGPAQFLALGLTLGGVVLAIRA